MGAPKKYILEIFFEQFFGDGNCYLKFDTVVKRQEVILLWKSNQKFEKNTWTFIFEDA